MADQRSLLTDRDKQVLDFESSWWLYPGPKDRAIREYLGMSSTRYYQALRRLVDDPRAMAHAPLAVRRLRRLHRGRLEALASTVEDGDTAG